MALNPRISKVGFGCYRVARNCNKHKEALIAAISGGVNLVDTSANYGDGSAEELLGDVLSNGQFNRRNVTVVSKFGYIQGQNLRRHDNEGLIFPEVVNCSTHLKHCIHPDFMRDQLVRSLERMQLSYIDVYLLHNPEYFITHNINKKKSASKSEVEAVQQEMLRRIANAFEALEYEVQKTGRVISYGISSNSFSLKSTDPHFLPYEGLIGIASQAACKVSGNLKVPSGFKFVQFPANLVEIEGLNGCAKWASDNDVAVLTNRPLNAFNEEGSWRLADYGDEDSRNFSVNTDLLLNSLGDEDIQGELKRAVQHVASSVVPKIECILNYDYSYHRYISPVLGHPIHEMKKHPARNFKILELIEVSTDREWTKCLEGVVRYRSGVNARSDMKTKFNYDVPDNLKLQEFAVQTLLNSSGVTCVLVGMREINYVKEVLSYAL